MNKDFIECDFNNNSIDLVYSATAFHWLPEEEAFSKIKNILSNSATIALFWNHPYPNREEDLTNKINRKIYNKYRPTNKEIKEFNIEDLSKYTQKLKENGFKNVTSKLYKRKRTLSSKEYIDLLNTYSDHRALPIDIKEAFEKDMKMSLDEAGGYINIYDTIDLYLGRK